MLLPILFLASQALNRADALNEALTKCLFATARAAHQERQSTDTFRSTLSRSCESEEAAARTAAISILVGRGAPRDQAEHDIDRTLKSGRDAVLKAYAYGMPH